MVSKRPQEIKKLEDPASIGPLQESWSRSLNLATSTRNGTTLNGMDLLKQLVITVKINGKKARAMIDSGAIGNFVSNTFVTRNGIPFTGKKEPYQLSTVDGSASSYGGGWVQMETDQSSLKIGQHKEKINLDITRMPGHDIILEILWLKMHNPQIDWVTGRVQLAEESNRGIRPEGHPEGEEPPVEIKEISQNTMMQMWKRGEQVGVLYLTLAPDLMIGSMEQRKDQLPSTGIEAVPKEYWDFEEVFKERGRGQLPEHQPWDHEIPLKPGTQPAFKPIYPLSEKAHEALREYVEKNLEQGYIWHSTSPAGYPILFVSKKNRKL
ncbi:hypothetical protein VTN00DRAFT_632 [Thermoascus crustaceus]|uniref:uncharacterized protein n=1 Tax=Thermoascus crustaceus TaxID=5088 RepID=UPI003742C5F5